MTTETTRLTSAPLPDVCRNKHQGNDLSEEANLRIHSRKKVDRERIKTLASARGDFGVTLHEVCSALGMKVQTASARLADLKADSELISNGQRRNHAGVFVVPKGQTKLF